MAIDITRLSERALEARYTKAIAAHSKANQDLIDAGRGMELWSVTRTLSDPLSVRFNATSNEFFAVADEMAARRRYSGTLKPIKREA